MVLAATVSFAYVVARVGVTKGVCAHHVSAQEMNQIRSDQMLHILCLCTREGGGGGNVGGQTILRTNTPGICGHYDSDYDCYGKKCR